MFERINQVWPIILLCTLICCLSVGCGQTDADYETPELVPVEGMVNINGKPAAGVIVTQSPMGTTSGQVSYGMTDDMGKFVCEYAQGGVGCPQGQYAVTCSKMVTPDGKPIPEVASAADVMAENMIPARYRDSRNPFMTEQIGPAGITNLTIDLKIKK
ncbi:hypothetical protein OAK47_00595 [Planctomycetaceae bacterium]|jgi:hypothetical protein|nr:hypothetical protein [Planctomycetaceae bacterium]MDC0307638.1 hypothetical protein [Planctomycetaceae bacterium]